MKTMLTILLVLLLTSCQKEYSFEGDIATTKCTDKQTHKVVALNDYADQLYAVQLGGTDSTGWWLHDSTTYFIEVTKEELYAEPDIFETAGLYIVSAKFNYNLYGYDVPAIEVAPPCGGTKLRLFMATDYINSLKVGDDFRILPNK